MATEEKTPITPEEELEKSGKPKKEKKPKPVKENKPLNKKLLIIIAGALVVLIAVGVILFVFVFNKKDLVPNDAAAESSSETASSDSSSASETASSDSSSTADTASSDASPSSDAVSSDAASDAGTASSGISSASESSSQAAEPKKPFTFSEETLQLSTFGYRSGNAMEAAVHRDVQQMLEEMDDRPGVCIPAVVIADSFSLDDGTLRVIAYVWGNRYAISDNTLFDYGSVIGPCALDYSGGYQLQRTILPQEGDAYEQSIQEICAGREALAQKLIGKAYDLEVRGQMIRNVSSYIAANNVPVSFFRAASQTYHSNGEVYVDPAAASSRASSDSSSSDSASSSSSSSDSASSSSSSSSSASSDSSSSSSASSDSSSSSSSSSDSASSSSTSSDSSSNGSVSANKMSAAGGPPSGGSLKENYQYYQSLPL